MKLKLLIILSNYYEPNNLARPEIREVFGNYFRSLGNNTIWIMPSGKNIGTVKKIFFMDIPVYVIPRYISQSFIFRLLKVLPFLYNEYKTADSIIRTENCNIIQVRNVRSGGLLAIYFKWKYKIPFVFQLPFRINFINRHNKNILKQLNNNILHKLDDMALRIILHNADLILPQSKLMENNLVNEGVSKKKMLCFPMGVNTDTFSPSVSGEVVRVNHKISANNVLVYVGTIDRLRNLEILVIAVEIIKKSLNKLHILVHRFHTFHCVDIFNTNICPDSFNHWKS